MQSSFSNKTLTLMLNNWDDDDYDNFKEWLFRKVKSEFNDVIIEEKTEVLYDLNKGD